MEENRELRQGKEVQWWQPPNNLLRKIRKYLREFRLYELWQTEKMAASLFCALHNKCFYSHKLVSLYLLIFNKNIRL